MINVILFDLGGVLIPEMASSIDSEIAKKFCIPYGIYLKKVDEVKPLVRRGNITLLDMYSEIVKSFGKNANPESMLQEHVELYKRSSTKRDDQVVSLIKKLRGAYDVCCITETEYEIAEINKQNGLFSYFSKSYLSIELGYTKLESKMYLKALEDLGCRPDEVLLIDDRMDCVGIACSVGMKGIVFKNVVQLEGILRTVLTQKF